MAKLVDRAFWLLWWTVGFGLLIMSVQTVVDARAMRTQQEVHAVLIGVVEAISALLFLVPKTLKIGAAGLLFTILVAFLIHTVAAVVATRSLMHPIRWDLLIYAAAVLYVRVHGVGRAANVNS